ncbi:MAG: M28 family metallopeptidase [Pirellulaceae bacterium]|jgi:acetylornithine deacetylase/succinyl-diaminopimelate desuccinylase-like protein|nr:M28 family metallopeptidase [Pirellulaceae bacterium]
MIRSHSATTPTEVDVIRRLVRTLERRFPRRASGSVNERRAQELLAEEFERRGLSIAWQPFRASRSLYAVLAWHNAVAVAGSVVFIWQPLVGALLQLFAGISYLLDCHYRAYLLRRLVPRARSQNLIATLPAAAPVRRRVVFTAHADAAPTGWMFEPAFLYWIQRFAPQRPAILRRHMFGWLASLVVLSVLAVIRATTDWWWFPIWYGGLTLASLVPLVLMLQIVLTNRIVPGANDNLSGCAALVLLAERLQSGLPDDCEVVLVVTGCEESGRGGAEALAREMRDEWPAASTTFLVLDTISGGDLRYMVEGEIWPIEPPSELVEQIQAVARETGREALRAYHAPAGATDAAPLLLAGYDAVCLSRIDERIDLPRNYHLPTDRSGNLSCEQAVETVDLVERLARHLASDS